RRAARQHLEAKTIYDNHLQQQQQQENTGQPGRELIDLLGAADLTLITTEASLLFCLWAGWRLTDIVLGNVFWIRQGGRVYRWVRLDCHSVSFVFLTQRGLGRRRSGMLGWQLLFLGVLVRAGVVILVLASAFPKAGQVRLHVGLSGSHLGRNATTNTTRR